MRLADLAWCDVDTTTIKNCWQKAGILPELDSSPSHTTELLIPVSSLLQKSSQMNPAAEAERQVEAALDALATKGHFREQTEWTSKPFLTQKVNPRS